MTNPPTDDLPKVAPTDVAWALTASDKHERAFLAGPASRIQELARVFRIAAECIRGFRRLHFVGPCITVFGSARFGETHPYYALAREVGGRLAKLGATEDGTLRGHMWMPTGYFRDSVYFSVLAADWPSVRQGLEARLAAYRT